MLRRLAAGLPAGELRSLPSRMRQLVKRLEVAGHVERHQHAGRMYLELTAAARSLVPSAPRGRPARVVEREHLDLLDLPGVPPFRILELPRPIGRPSTPGGRIYLKRLPPHDYDPTQHLDETTLALLVFAPRACRELVARHAGRDWSRLRERIHAEELVPRARYFGISKLIGLRERRTRHDAYHRAKTEPKPRRGAAP